MAQLFSVPGDTTEYGANSPGLSGVCIPAIDSRGIADGYGVVAPLGGSGTTRQIVDYGDSSVTDTDDIPDMSLTGRLLAYNTANYDLQTVDQPSLAPLSAEVPEAPEYTITSPSASGVLSPTSIGEDLDAWSSADTIMYSSVLQIFWDHQWTLLSIANIATWNDLDTDTDGSFALLASDSGIYVSSDSGSSWAQKDPGSETYSCVNCSGASGNATALGEDSAEDGKMWKSTNYGVSWSSVSISV